MTIIIRPTRVLDIVFMTSLACQNHFLRTGKLYIAPVSLKIWCQMRLPCLPGRCMLVS